MEVFARVAECASFSRAAESLDLANATVTACVRNLERHLNVTLIHRDTRRFRLTEEGEVYLVRARELLQSFVRAEDEVRSQPSALRGPLHIEVTISLGQLLLSPALPAFAQRYPEISIAVTLTNQPHNLIERAIDVAVRFGRVEDADLIARPLYEARYVLCGAPRIVRSLPKHPQDLDARLCVGMLPEESRFPSPWQLERGDSKVVIQPQGPLHFNNADAAMIAAKSGVGVAYVLDVFAKPHFEAGALVHAYPEWSLPAKTFYVVTTKDRANSAKVRAFTDFLFEVFDSTRRPSSHLSIVVKKLKRR
jgi:DNA-binding transcriptional LysR family regulator